MRRSIFLLISGLSGTALLIAAISVYLLHDVDQEQMSHLNAAFAGLFLESVLFGLIIGGLTGLLVLLGRFFLRRTSHSPRAMLALSLGIGVALIQYPWDFTIRKAFPKFADLSLGGYLIAATVFCAAVLLRDILSQSNDAHVPYFSQGTPNAGAVMKRAIILKAIYAAGLVVPPMDVLQEMMAQWSAEESEQFKKDIGEFTQPIVEQLKSSDLWRDVEAGERAFLQGGLSSENDQARIDASWLAESIACLLWALQMIPSLPPYDQETGSDLVQEFKAASIQEAVNRAQLRPKDEIEKQRNLAELWHWRARTRRLQEEGKLDGQYSGLTIAQIIAMTASKAADKGDIGQPINGDFPALGKSYGELTSDEFAVMTSIAQERHKAFNWLCGRSKSGLWADTPTDT